MRKMKDSRIEWIGEIPETWYTQKVKYCFSIVSGSGFAYSLQGQENGDLPICKASDISNAGHYLNSAANYLSNEQAVNNGFSIIPKGSVLFPKIGEAMRKNRRAISCIPCCLDNNCQAIVPYSNIDSDFSYFTMLCVDMLWFDNNGTVPCVNNVKFINSFFPYPPFHEQRLIASFLNSKCAEIDALTADIQAQIDTLEQYKRSVITEAVTKGLNPDVEMKDSGIEWIGKIPAHWEIIRGKYILKYLQKPVREDDGVITCFRDGEVTLRSNRREDGFTMSDKEIGYQGVDVGDLVVHGMDGFAGSIGISDSRGKASPVLNVLDTKQDKRYIMYYLRSMAYSDVFLAMATGIRVRSCDLRWNKLAELSYPVPPVTEQKAIVEYIDGMINKTDAVIADKKGQLETLEEYKKSLIFEYVTGKKEVGTWK